MKELRTELRMIEARIEIEGYTDYLIEKKVSLMKEIGILNQMECKK